MTRQQTTIRKATVADLPVVFDLVKELAVYERAPEQMTTSLSEYEKCFKQGVFEVLVAEMQSEVVGIALYYTTFSTWKGKMLYLEDFVVREHLRRQGIGERLFRAFLKEAEEAGAALCKWQVLDWNTPALNFYRKFQIREDADWIDVKYDL